MLLKLAWKAIEFFLYLITSLVMGKIGAFTLLISLLTLLLFGISLGPFWTITAIGNAIAGFGCLAFSIHFLEGLVSKPK